MNAVPKNLYDFLPVALQTAACSLYSWKLNSSRYDASFDNILKEAEERLSWSSDRIQDYRNRKLQAFVKHAVESVPYYRRLFRQYDLDPNTIRSIEDLNSLPILTKSEAIKQGNALRSDVVPNNQILMTHTSGSTGAGFHFATTRKADRMQWATWWRYYRMHGIFRTTPSAAFLAQRVVPINETRAPFWRRDVFTGRTFFSSYHMSPENLPDYLGELRQRKFPWIQGRPSSLTLLASFIVDTGADLGYQVRWITSASENLSTAQAALIEKAFGVKPIQHYGMAEAVANISQHSDGMLRLDEDFAAIELKPGEYARSVRIIGTNFTNLATPLIRYDTGDIAEVDSPTFPRVVTTLEGRGEDFIVLANGQKIGAINRAFEDATNVREAQIHQSIPGEITVLVAKRPNFSNSDEENLRTSLRDYLGAEMRIEFEYTSMVERTTSGKVRAVVSQIENARRI